MITRTIWHGCYDSSWSGFISKESFSHPAKFARGLIERIHAMLTSESRHGDLFRGETVQTRSRKSFFRRLAEKKGSPAIDFEEVIIARK